MGHISIQIQVCILLFALTFHYMAEREFFFQHTALSWDEARNHCKVCYDDLVTLTPDNTQIIVKNLTCDYWIGLRKNFSVTGCDLPWSRWANGDPLIFQNWYPDWAMTLPSPCFVCEGSIQDSPCTCSIHSNAISINEFNNTKTNNTEAMMTNTAETNNTETMMTAMAAKSPEHCVAMASFGAWMKVDCSKRLPFICYEDRFYGNITVTNVTSSSATLTWLAVPRSISHYRIEVNGHFKHNVSQIDLTYDLSKLTAGTLYSVKVFPVRCARKLNPQTDAFYTRPQKVENLSVISVTETSIFMKWSQPVGNVAFYLVKDVESPNLTVRSVTESAEISGLTPGNHYTFKVLTGVGDESVLGEAVTTTVYTRPSEVSDLRVAKNSGNSLLLKWAPPVGNNSGYRVKALDDSKHELFSEDVNKTRQSVMVTNLTEGTKVLLIVTSLTNGSLEGGAVNVTNFTAPAKVSNLTVNPTADTLNASWYYPTRNHILFIVEIQMAGSDGKTTLNGTERVQVFNKLKSGTRYSVTVYARNGHLLSEPEVYYISTWPLPPDGVKITSTDKHQIVLEWKPPSHPAEFVTLVKAYSPFFQHTYSERLINKTTCTFDGLNSGTLYEFEVRSVAGELKSEPRRVSNSTVAVKREVTLSMLCSSNESLLCHTATTRDAIIGMLRSHINKTLHGVFWELKTETTTVVG